MAIHPTALVSAEACLDDSAEVGPYCVIGPGVRLGARVRLHAHVVIEGHTDIGADCCIFPFASLGTRPQDKKYDGEASRLVVGEGTTIREGVTANLGTAAARMETRIGSRCLLMAYAHVAHDCRLGDGCILANAVALAGHVDVGDGAILGGLAAVHQFCRIGALAFIGGGSMVAADVPPYCIAQGDRAQLAGLNLVGLKRAGFSRRVLSALNQVYRCIFYEHPTQAAGLRAAIASDALEIPEAARLVEFVREARERGVAGPRLRGRARLARGDAPMAEA